MNNKIQLICRGLRWAVIGISLAAVVYLVWSYVTTGAYNFGSDSNLFTQLWQSDAASAYALILITSPGLLLWAAMLYWLVRLLKNFERGEYFSDDSIHCFLWLVWINGLKFVAQIAATLALAYYHSLFYESTPINLSLDLGELFSLMFMIIIVHILKAARDIDQENKEFI